MKKFLEEGIKRIGIKISDVSVENLLKYLKLLVEYNSHTNLTAIRDEEGILEKHFMDSMLIHQLLKESDESAIDIGTGAGFPGMVLAICNPKIKFTLMDSVGKKTNFLNMVKDELALENVRVVNARAEEFITEEN
ncbi:MAG: 16S rRNA (guanine(527)-N(7))-methyltransferase RsmG, partial [Fusobacteriaceae bacterium]